jgi:peptidoglycan/LPS O-acetylase OafA/YrhL
LSLPIYLTGADRESLVERVRGLDAIRAVCAFWVVMGHFGGPPITAGFDRSTRSGWLIAGLYNNFWNGPAAVIVFFVISGFCIHYPSSRTLQIPSIAGYAARRYLRIGLPLAVAMVVSPYLGVKLGLFHDSILWSLVAELVYYTLYPALLALRRRGVEWRWMVAVSFIAALVLVATDPMAKNYASWGIGLNWLLGLPCWLLGCELAERTTQDRLPSSKAIWRWRLAVWLASVTLSVLRFHSPVGYPWTLNLFALLVACWLGREISRYQVLEPPRWLEWAGRWSYSVYLIHLPANALFAMLALPKLVPMANWLVQMGFILIASYVYYLGVEFPSHLAARSVGRALTRDRSSRPEIAPELTPVAEAERIA